MKNNVATEEIRDAADHVARALGVTLDELEKIAADLAADHSECAPGELLLLALGDVVRRDPQRSDLVGAVEAGEILRVSRARVHQLAERSDFPLERYDLAAGKLWARADIIAFDKTWSRKVGRPRKSG